MSQRPATTAPIDVLREALQDAAHTVGGDSQAGTRATLERPKRDDHGDYATNVAMLLAPVVGGPPRDIAGRVGEELQTRLGPLLDRVEVAGPGFLNLFLSDAWHADALAHVLAAGEAFGGGGATTPEKIDVEFVSANPTGPLHVGHARNAAYGDALSRIYTLYGHEVTREYYVNDFGSQIARLAESVQARAKGEDVAEDGYQGDYIQAVADAIPGAAEAELAELGAQAVALMVERIKASLHAFGVDFEVWFSEKSLHDPKPQFGGKDEVTHAFERLAELEQTYHHEDALWLRSTAHGDDKDRVLMRSSGEHTYFASDIAYMLDKRERGFDRFVYVLGADHHGYRARMAAAFESLGGDTDTLDLLIMQFVHLVERGERSSMSKRSGEFVTLDDLVSEIGVDAARWFLLQRSHDTMIDLDLDLAREQSSENPVYYVQYAHARIASVLAKAGADRVKESLAADHTGVAMEPGERALIKKLLAFPEEVGEAAARRAPHRISTYALELAQTFTAFYRDCQVVGAEGEGVEEQRIALSVAAQRTIASALGLLGVSAPESMSRD
ncbi:MAG: arginine--tRNA ligase [Solirubrobacteraceae bacterium]|nr:arginine--tRNA ligase [Solirubrobacteraceae bacterium]